MADYANDVLVSTAWVQEHLDDPEVRISEVDEDPSLYAEAHIPGAIGLDWRTDLQDDVRRDFLGPEEFSALMASKGVSNEHIVVLYGDRNNWFAAYTYWYFKYYGHWEVRLVNGPREKWIAEAADQHRGAGLRDGHLHRRRGRRGPARLPRRRDGGAGHRHEARRRALTPGVLRRADRDGRVRAGGCPARRPHPGAASVPWAQAVTEDGTFKSADELRELYGPRDCWTGRRHRSCRIGERSAHTWFVLHELLGQDDVKNYDGSWTEWGNLVGVPVVKDV